MLPSLTKINKSLCFGNIILRNLSKSPKIQFENTENEKKLALPLENRFLYREFLPDPEMKFRNAIREKLERHNPLTNSPMTASSILGGFESVRTLVRNHFPRPREKKRINQFGWETRMKTANGRKILMRRILKGRHILSH
uniref:Large ribosomal subunit protein bL34m n=1 Tax=Cacopsylla melanoneura TaxID=428564 RepID=A0A8D8XVB4_9HEMI